MKNYELLLMFNVNQDESTEQTIAKYKDIVSANGGTVDRGTTLLQLTGRGVADQ